MYGIVCSLGDSVGYSNECSIGSPNAGVVLSVLSSVVTRIVQGVLSSVVSSIVSSIV